MAGTSGSKKSEIGDKDFRIGLGVLGLFGITALLIAFIASSDGDNENEGAAPSGAEVSAEADAAEADAAEADAAEVAPAELEAEANDLRARLEAAGFTVGDVAITGTQASLRVTVEGDGRITAHVLGTTEAAEAFAQKAEGLKSNPSFKGGAEVEVVGSNVYVGKFPVESAANEATFNEVVAAGGGTG